MFASCEPLTQGLTAGASSGHLGNCSSFCRLCFTDSLLPSSTRVWSHTECVPTTTETDSAYRVKAEKQRPADSGMKSWMMKGWEMWLVVMAPLFHSLHASHHSIQRYIQNVLRDDMKPSPASSCCKRSSRFFKNDASVSSVAPEKRFRSQQVLSLPVWRILKLRSVS